MRFHRVLLVQPMHEKLDNKKRTSISFPWGLASIGTCMQEAGCAVEVLDGQALQLPKEELTRELDAAKYDLIGITAFSTQFNAVRLLSSHIKRQSEVPVVIGGPLATYQPELVLQETEADICVMGEGEITICQLLRGFHNLGELKGIAFRKDGDILVAPPQDELASLDELSFPDLALFDMEKYVHKDNPYARHKARGRAMTFIASRGCPYSCNFCSKSSRAFRIMSPRRVAENLEFLKKELAIEEISFGDELFLSSRKRFREMAPLLKSLGLPWGAQGRVNLVNKEILDLAKSSGCIGIGYGIESGSQKILDNMNKHTTVEQIEKAMLHTQKIGMPVKVQLIFGYPGEDESTVQETIDLLDRVDHPGRRFNVITPIPGSPLYEQCMREGRIRDEAEFLCAIEKNFGWGRVHVNFTQWPDDEIYPRKKAAEQLMRRNYFSKTPLRRLRYALSRLKSRVLG